ncbi:inverse autotransporter beta domain-containing protein, partial [Providencia rettgeri]|uniref:inverse autotransporter beta domain-containing protein n=1 Tax=Providencia rettgeri TaxID=587 RepID=UPI0032DB0D46
MNTMNKKFTSLILLQISFFIFWSFFSIGNANENKQEHWLILENTSEQSINDLPELPTEPINKQDNNQKFIAEKGSKLGTILSSENSTNTARNMLENTLMQKINRDINNWFNQVAYARIQFNTDKSGNAAILYPLYDKDSHIVFTQLGLQINEDRTTTNMGFGYRQLNNDWMWGVNSFYDSTSSNRRLGLGAEAS